MALPKQSIYIPTDGGLSSGDADEFTVEAPNSITADNLVHRETGAVQSAPYLALGTETFGSPATVAVLGGRPLFAADAIYDMTDYTNLVEVPSSASLASMSVVNVPLDGHRMVQPHSATTPLGHTCVAAWNLDSGSVDYSVMDESGEIVASGVFAAAAFNPRVCVIRYGAGGSATSPAGYRFVIGAKLEAGGFQFGTYSHLGAYVTGASSAMTWNSTLRNGWVLEPSTTSGQVVAICLNSAGTDLQSYRFAPGSAPTINATVSHTGAVIGGGRAGSTDGHIYVVADSSVNGVLFDYNGSGVYAANLILPAESTGTRYNIAGVGVNTDGGALVVFRSSVERLATEALPPATAGTHYEAHLGDARLFPALAATEATVLASTLRVGTRCNRVSLYPSMSILDSFSIPGVGVLGNGTYVGGKATMPYEWGFPCAADNARPSSGATSHNGHPFPYASDLAAGVYTYPFNQTTNIRPQSFRPPIHNSQYPTAENSITFSLGASLEEQEGQAHYALVAHNATTNFQEGRLGLILQTDVPAQTHSVVSSFLSTRLSSRSNAANNRTKSTWSDQGTQAFMLSSRVDAVAATASHLEGLAIPTCDLQQYATGKHVMSVTCASDSAYFSRNIKACRLVSSGNTASLAADSESQLASFGSMPCAISGSSVSPGFVPRPTHITLWGQSAIGSDYSVQQRSTFQGDPSYYVEHGYVYVRYRVKVASGKSIVSQLSPPLAVICRPRANQTLHWATDNTIHSETDALQITQWREYGPYVAGISRDSGGGGTATDFRRAVMVPAIPWLNDEQVELDIYVDDVGTDLDVANTGGGFWGGASFTTYAIGRPAAGQPRYVGTVKPERIFGGAMSKWFGFYFGTNDPSAPLRYEVGSFAPTPSLGVSEPIAADALEATPMVPATPVTLSSYGDRVLAFCSDGREEIWISKPSVKGVFAQFSDELVSNVPPDGGRTVAGVAFEERLLVFKRDRVLVSSGQLPDATGSGGSLSEFSPLTSEVGCISKGSILLTPMGVVFESARGFCMVTPGGSVDYIGGQVSDLSGVGSTQNCVASALNTVTGECMFSMASAPADAGGCYVLVWNYRFNKWSKLTMVVGASVSSLASYDGAIWGALYDSNDDITTPIVLTNNPVLATGDLLEPLLVSTGWVRINGVSNYFRVNRATILARINSGTAGLSTITVRSFVNYSSTVDTEAEFDTSSVVDSSGNIRIIFYMRTQKCQSMRFEVEVDRANSVEAIENDLQVSVLGVQLDAMNKAGSFKGLGSGNRG